jgi:hypothetical protein
MKLIRESDTTAMEIIKVKSERAMNEAFAVLDGIKEGKISLSEATEMSNALGKVNAAIGNIIKADLVCLAFEKQATNYAKERLMELHS